MTLKLLDRLYFSQGGRCFFCRLFLPRHEASVEHLFASSNGGPNSDDNCVACCKAVNSLLGRMPLKEKFRVVLDQPGHFQCPADIGSPIPVADPAPPPPAAADLPAVPPPPRQRLEFDRVVVILKNQHRARPRTLKSLTNAIAAMANGATAEEVAEILAQLQARRLVLVDGTSVIYAL